MIYGIFESKVYSSLLFSLYKKNNYLTKINKCDEELIVKNIGSINVFKEKIEKGELFEKNISLYERSQNGYEVYVWECETTEQDKFGKCVCQKNK